MALHELIPEIPEAHQGWTDDQYFNTVLVSFSKAVEIDLSANNQTIVRQGNFDEDERIRAALADAGADCLEWAKVRGWEIVENFGLRINWNTQGGLLRMVARAVAGIGIAHWSNINSNPSRAEEGLNTALGFIEDYFRYRQWPLEEDIASRLNHR